MTGKLYMRYHALDEKSLSSTALILRLDRKEGVLVLDQTVFHPQGGGQKSDVGVIRNELGVMVVSAVVHGEYGEVLHFGELPDGFEVGQEVTLLVEPEKRKEFAAYHTGGHLLAALIEKLHPTLNPLKGHHWPGEAKVEFEVGATELPEKEVLLSELNQAVQDAIRLDLPVLLKEKEGVRQIQIGTFGSVSCGGTHVASLAALEGLSIKQIKKKSGKLLVRYEIAFV